MTVKHNFLVFYVSTHISRTPILFSVDGLYVLLKPQKKGTGSPDFSKVPPHLRNLISDKFSNETCPWSLSGPQFPQPTAIQQRYCYPKGDAEYSSRKGGALWTMYGADGKEDLEFRLLHVYYSAKRAVNKGVSTSKESSSRAKGSSYSPSNKRAKRAHAHDTTPPHRIHRPDITVSATPTPELTSPTITASSGTPSLGRSTGSIDIIPPGNRHSYINSPSSLGSAEGRINNISSLSSTSFINFNDTAYDDIFLTRRFHPVGQELHNAGSFSQFSASGDSIGGAEHPGQGPGLTRLHGINNAHTAFQNVARDRQSSRMSMNDSELNFSYWNEPLLEILMKPSQDQDGDVVGNFGGHLEVVHKNIREMILRSPANEQASLISSFAGWAKDIAKDPLEPNNACIKKV